MKRWKGIAIVAALAAVAAGVAYATIPDAGGVVHGCVSKSGVLRVIDTGAGGACTTGETPLDWSQKGPAGPPGPPGPQGEAAPAANALHATIQIVGSQQGAFTQTPVPIGGLDHEIVSPRDVATGQASGRRQHKPITFVKVMGAPTPMLLNALVNNENLPTVKIAITDGTSNTVMTIELTNASVASWTQVGDHERVSMTYQKITWTWLDGGITAEDDWATAVS